MEHDLFHNYALAVCPERKMHVHGHYWCHEIFWNMCISIFWLETGSPLWLFSSSNQRDFRDYGMLSSELDFVFRQRIGIQFWHILLIDPHSYSKYINYKYDDKCPIPWRKSDSSVHTKNWFERKLDCYPIVTHYIEQYFSSAPTIHFNTE